MTIREFIEKNNKFCKEHDMPLFVVIPVTGWVVTKYEMISYASKHPHRTSYLSSSPLYSVDSTDSTEVVETESVVGVIPAVAGIFEIRVNAVDNCDDVVLFNQGVLESYSCCFESLEDVFDTYEKKYAEQKKEKKG